MSKIEWLKPKKSDKGAIILHIKGQFNLFLWAKSSLDEWMFMLNESIERLKLRRSGLMPSRMGQNATQEMLDIIRGTSSSLREQSQAFDCNAENGDTPNRRQSGDLQLQANAITDSSVLIDSSRDQNGSGCSTKVKHSRNGDDAAPSSLSNTRYVPGLI